MENNIKKNQIQSPFVIFLDSQEILSNEYDNSLQDDLWLRSSNSTSKGLIFSFPNTLWVIASRQPLKWKELDDFWNNENLLCSELQPFTIEETLEYISKKTSSMSVKMGHELANGLFNLTKGNPAYLKSCCDFYILLLEENPNRILTLNEFGHNNNQLVENFLRPLPICIKQMLYVLAWLRQWNDALIETIGSKTLINFNIKNYIEIKKFSFIIEDEDKISMDANIRDTICKNEAKQYYSEGILERLYNIIIVQNSDINLNAKYCMDFKMRALPQIIYNQKDFSLFSANTLLNNIEYIQLLYNAQMFRKAMFIAEEFLHKLITEKNPSYEILDAISKVNNLLEKIYFKTGDFPKRELAWKQQIEYYENLIKRRDNPLVMQFEIKIKILEELYILYQELEQENQQAKILKQIILILKNKWEHYIQLGINISIEGTKLCLDLAKWHQRNGDRSLTKGFYKIALKQLDKLYLKYVELLGECDNKTLEIQWMKIDILKKLGTEEYIAKAFEELSNLLEKYRLVQGEHSNDVEKVILQMITLCNHWKLDNESTNLTIRLYEIQSLYWPYDYIGRVEKIDEFLKIHSIACNKQAVMEYIATDALVWRTMLLANMDKNNPKYISQKIHISKDYKTLGMIENYFESVNDCVSLAKKNKNGFDQELLSFMKSTCEDMKKYGKEEDNNTFLDYAKKMQREIELVNNFKSEKNNNLDPLRILKEKAVSLETAKNYNELLKIRTEIYNLCVEQNSVHNFNAVSAQEDIARVLCLLNRFEEAKEIQLKVIQYAKHYLKDESAFYVLAIELLMHIYQSQEKYDLLVETYISHWNIEFTIYGEFDPSEIVQLASKSTKREALKKFFIKNNGEENNYNNLDCSIALAHMYMEDGDSDKAFEVLQMYSTHQWETFWCKPFWWWQMINLYTFLILLYIKKGNYADCMDFIQKKIKDFESHEFHFEESQSIIFFLMVEEGHVAAAMDETTYFLDNSEMAVVLEEFELENWIDYIQLIFDYDCRYGFHTEAKKFLDCIFKYCKLGKEKANALTNQISINR